MQILSFQEVLKKAEIYTTKHLLLGNGFSIACDPSIFTYDSLYNEANFDAHPEIYEVFKLLQTNDFEKVIHILENASITLPAYQKNSEDICNKMHLDSVAIKDLLIATIATRHPAFPSEISEEAYSNCRTFLAYFIDKNNSGRVYSLNYDLLLYWTLMHELDDKDSTTKFSDGFGRDSWFDNGETSYSTELTWQGKSGNQNIHYLHGALHLFDKGNELQKICWNDSGSSLLEQTRLSMTNGDFPLFVTEGDNIKKMEKINHTAYLYSSFKSFEDVTNSGKNKSPGNTCLFTYGVSFSENDKHIFNKIASGRIKHLFVSIYGESTTVENKKIIALAEALKSQRQKFPLEITYYDAASANVWG